MNELVAVMPEGNTVGIDYVDTEYSIGESAGQANVENCSRGIAQDVDHVMHAQK